MSNPNALLSQKVRQLSWPGPHIEWHYSHIEWHYSEGRTLNANFDFSKLNLV